MSNVKCTSCGRVIVRCPHCQALLGENTEDKSGYVFPVVPTIDVDLNKNEEILQQPSKDWVLETALPEPEEEVIGAAPVLGDFFSNAPVKPSVQTVSDDINPNPEIKRASIVPKASGNMSTEYAKHRIKDTYGNYDVEALTRLAVEQQFHQEKIRKRRNKMIRRIIFLLIILFIVVKNWPWIVYFCRVFFGGWGAVLEIFGLLGDVATTIPTPQ